MIDYERLIKVDFEVKEKNLNSVDILGLERGLQLLVEDYEHSTLGEVVTDINNHTIKQNNRLYIDNGYIIENHYINYMTCTDNGIILVNCYEWDSEKEDYNEEKEYYLRVN